MPKQSPPVLSGYNSVRFTWVMYRDDILGSIAHIANPTNASFM
jgi:hypothetical protein